MKLLRYGPAGAEKPALLDNDGAIRCLAGVLRDIDGFALSPGSLKMLEGIDPTSLPRVEGNPRIGPCVVRPVMPRKLACRCQRNRSSFSNRSGRSVDRMTT